MATLTMEPKTAVPDLMLSQTRVIRAPRARVYEAWTDPNVLMQWFGPAGMHSPAASIDLRVGGEYRIEVQPDIPPANADPTQCGSRTSCAVGHFVQVVPDELLQFTWTPNWYPDEESMITIMLKDVPGGTELTLVHERFLYEASRDGHNTGWAGSIVKLAALLEA